jgi:hypothetical protein
MVQGTFYYLLLLLPSAKKGRCWAVEKPFFKEIFSINLSSLDLSACDHAQVDGRGLRGG